jgi:para-aminobenzoate synthetase/4-amino-4-deoxychorismate lyase
MVNADEPFVLLDDARGAGAVPARLYRAPEAIVTARSAPELRAALDKIAAAQASGLHAAGSLSYEAGYALEQRLSARSVIDDFPLLWFGLFRHFEEIAPENVAALLPPAASAWAATPVPRVTQSDYTTTLGIAQAYIAAGDIYQANLTFPCDVRFQGSPLALYAGMRARAKAGYCGIVFTGEAWLLSFSPELFFALDNDKLTARPMKGTVARAGNDMAETSALIDDPKQCAENLMIVDLIRNDLSRVAEAGSVKVPALFTVETYPQVHTMTSTVTANLRGNLSAIDVLRATFPCGSITGAPKIRAMEIIAELERTPRGPYTGSIGRIDAGGDAAFNVAIRTLHIPIGSDVARMGLGSGIVADSDAHSEWQECADKGAFVASPVTFDLIETMRFDPDGGITLLDGHLARLGASAKQFGFTFNRHDVRNALQAATIRHSGARTLRLRLSQTGAIAIEVGALPPRAEGVVEVVIVPLPVDTSDFRLRHKTSDRDFYDVARRASGAFEVLFTDKEGFLTEGSFTNIFVPRDGVLLTPKAERGLLPGVFRSALVAGGNALEADLTLDDLADGLFIGNALRGLLPARLKSL